MIKFKSKTLNEVGDNVLRSYLDGNKNSGFLDSDEMRCTCVAEAAEELMKSDEVVFVFLCELLKEMLDSHMDNTQNKTVN